MQRFFIAILAVGTAAALTVAIYLRWEVSERDAQIALLERTTVSARKASERVAAQAAAVKAALQLAKEEILRLKEERDAALKTSKPVMAEAASR